MNETADVNVTNDYAKLQQVMEDYSEWVRTSAQSVLAYLDLHQKSVVDFGCGRGQWLQVARERGASALLGLDTYALESGTFDFPVERADLTRPLSLPRPFDVALCLYVGEHLPGSAARVLVGSLTEAAPLVLFASAVPGFGGVHHINEQPPAYWHEMFTERGYHCYDFRTEIWNDEAIEPWYRMGALVYARAGLPVAGLEKYRVAEPLHLIHPDIFQAYAPIGQNLILHYDRAKRRWYPEMI